MSTRGWIKIVLAATATVLAVGLFFAGRATVTPDTQAARDQGYAAGQRAGKADGLRLGRALQSTQALPPDMRTAAQDAFNAGYAAGANDVFAGYDGGWGLSAPYAIVLVPGTGVVTYRIDSRTPFLDGVDYYLCPHTQTLCQRPHR